MYLEIHLITYNYAHYTDDKSQYINDSPQQ